MENKTMAWDSYHKNEKEIINFQNIEEKLLRMAVKLTESFADEIRSDYL